MGILGGIAILFLPLMLVFILYKRRWKRNFFVDWLGDIKDFFKS